MGIFSSSVNLIPFARLSGALKDTLLSQVPELNFTYNCCSSVWVDTPLLLYHKSAASPSNSYIREVLIHPPSFLSPLQTVHGYAFIIYLKFHSAVLCLRGEWLDSSKMSSWTILIFLYKIMHSSIDLYIVLY